MVKTLTAGLTAVALVAATVSVPGKAEATPAWVVPALIVGGVVVGTAAVASSARAQAYDPGGSIYVQPRGGVESCKIVRQRTASGGWARVEICE